MSDLWFVYRNSSLSCWDEYIPLKSWSGYRKISENLKYQIDITGRYRTNSFGLKPY